MKNRKIIIIILLFISLLYLGYKDYEKLSFYKDTKMLNLEYDNFTFNKNIGGIKDNEYKLVYSEFNGMNSVWDITSKGDFRLKITLNSKVLEGKFKAVLLTSDSEVINVLEQSDNGTKSFDLKQGDTRLAIVGEKASGEIYIKVESEDNIELMPYYAITK